MRATHQDVVIERAHRAATTATVQEMAQLLQEVLSRRLTAYVAAVRDGKTVARWVAGDVAEIRGQETEQRLRTAYEIVALLLASETHQTARAWFIGLNPRLGDTPPADAIRAGRLQEALHAAQAFVANP